MNRRPGFAACPRCGQRAALDAGNEWRPFCSERCKLIDLGDWFAERHVIADAADAGHPADDDPAGDDAPQRRQ